MKILKKKSDFFRIILKNLISANLFFSVTGVQQC